MSLTPGQSLSSYEILALLGKGGMGEVYRARDTKLDRDVAIKVLPEEFARDEERLLRFQREAKLLASLDHPHIAAIYGFESAEQEGTDPVHFLVLEYVEGESLAQRLENGPLTLDDALEVCEQIAQGLAQTRRLAWCTPWSSSTSHLGSRRGRPRPSPRS